MSANASPAPTTAIANCRRPNSKTRSVIVHMCRFELNGFLHSPSSGPVVSAASGGTTERRCAELRTPEPGEVAERAAAPALEQKSSTASALDEPAEPGEIWIDEDLADDQPAGRLQHPA